jgi:hypothetical protein
VQNKKADLIAVCIIGVPLGAANRKEIIDVRSRSLARVAPYSDRCELFPSKANSQYILWPPCSLQLPEGIGRPGRNRFRLNSLIQATFCSIPLKHLSASTVAGAMNGCHRYRVEDKLL